MQNHANHAAPLPAQPATLPAIACIGGGNMGSAIVHSLLRLSNPPPLLIVDPAQEVAKRFSNTAVSVSSEHAAVAHSKVIILAVKPQIGETVALNLRPHLRPDHLLISILAGTTLATLNTWFPHHQHIIRAMPNTPMAIGEGMIGLAPKPGLDPDLINLAQQLFGAAGSVMVIKEEAIDGLTAISGSGPAYLFRFAEGLFQAALKQDFSPVQARQLVSQTLSGAVNYLLSQVDEQAGSDDDFFFPAAILRQQVTSPGGTTAAALEVFDQGNLVPLIANAVAAAQSRSRELAQGS